MTTNRLLLALTIQIAGLLALAIAGGPLWAIITLGTTTLLTVMLTYSLIDVTTEALTNGRDMLRGADFNSRLRKTGYSEADRLVSVFNSMMEQLHRERLSVREANRYLDLLVASSPLGIINMDMDGRIANANAAAVRMLGTGREPLEGKEPAELPGALGQAVASLRADESMSLDLRSGSGEYQIYRLACYSFIDRGFQRTAVFIEPMTDLIRDTERRAYGKLIRVMAHEINNSMGAVGGAFDLLADTPAVASDPDLAALVDSCGSRCRSLCRFVDSYAKVARLPEPKPVNYDIRELIERLMPALQATATTVTRGASVATASDEESFEAPVDPILMEQALVNIVKNAAESIAKTGRQDGKIVIDIRRRSRSVAIIDNGQGLSDDDTQQIFTPFFTTKRGAAASGIGLTLTTEILRQHKIGYSLQTDKESGETTFALRFPNA